MRYELKFKEEAWREWNDLIGGHGDQKLRGHRGRLLNNGSGGLSVSWHELIDEKSPLRLF